MRRSIWISDFKPFNNQSDLTKYIYFFRLLYLVDGQKYEARVLQGKRTPFDLLRVRVTGSKFRKLVVTLYLFF